MSNSILFVEYDFDIGGAEWVIFNLCNYMVDQGVLVTLYTNRESYFTNRLSGRIKLIIEKDMGKGINLVSKRLRNLVKHLRHNSYDLVFATERMTSSILYLANRITNSSSRVIIREAASNFSVAFDKTTFYKRLLLRNLFRYCYRRADLLIANSLGTFRSLQRNRLIGKSGNCYIIDNPLDIKMIQEKSMAEIPESINEKMFNRKTIMTIGRLDAKKRIDDIIRAIYLLRKNGEDVALLVLGEGPERLYYEKLIKDMKLDDSVFLVGHVSNPYPILKRADVFVLASEFEGFGMVVVEALALGLPVVASDIDGGPRQILCGGRFGKLFAVGDIQAMADYIKEYIDNRADPEFLKMRALEYDTSVKAKEYMEILGF